MEFKESKEPVEVIDYVTYLTEALECAVEKRCTDTVSLVLMHAKHELDTWDKDKFKLTV